METSMKRGLMQITLKVWADTTINTASQAFVEDAEEETTELSREDGHQDSSLIQVSMEDLINAAVRAIVTKEKTRISNAQLASLIPTFSGNLNEDIHAWCDNGTEYMNNELYNFCENQGIRVENTDPYCPCQNGKRGKLNRTIIQKARTLIAEYSVDHELWGEAVYTATYIINRIPTVEDIIPAEKWLGEKPDYAKLKTFGEKRAGKFDEKSKKMIFVGYTTNGFRLWDPDSRKIVRFRHVVFDESLPVKQLNLTTLAAESKENISEVINPENDNLETVQNDVVQQGEEPNEQVTQKRERKPPNCHKDYDTSAHYAFNAVEWVFDVPKTRREIRGFRIKNMATEANEATDEKRYKARLVAKGYQSSNYAETYSPVAKLSTFRTLMSIVNEFDYEMVQMDVRTAFLHGDLKKEIYMNLPEELTEKKYVCKLNRSICGLKQSPKNCDSSDQIEGFKLKLNQNFDVVDLGEVKSFIRLEIDRDISKGIIKIHQSAYIQQLLLKFQMQNCKEINTPIERNFKLNKAKSEDENTNEPYRQLQVSGLCQKRTLDSSSKRVLRYLKNTPRFGLMFIRSKSSTLIDTYVDGDWANDFDDRKSVTGFFVSVLGNIVSWGT
ncbi:hypothetical protein Trydic_g9818 [Trypoxylus dichotomus]